MIKCIIVDDDESDRMILKQLCKQYNDLHEPLYVQGLYDNARDALNDIQEDFVDFMLLDINMPIVSGIDVIEQAHNLPQIIFTTSNKEYAIEAFEYDVTDYLIKPVYLERLAKALDKVKRRIKVLYESQNNDFFIKIGSSLVKLEYNDILWVEAKGDYVLIQMRDKKHIIYSRLKSIEEKLPNHKFTKIHRSYIVNLSEVENIKESSLTIHGEDLPISRSKKSELKEKINKI